MKLTGSLKDKVEAVETKEEKRAIIAEAGMELTDDELGNVAGGIESPETYRYEKRNGAYERIPNPKPVD